jgi:hypothetical protein
VRPPALTEENSFAESLIPVTVFTVLAIPSPLYGRVALHSFEQRLI